MGQLLHFPQVQPSVDPEWTETHLADVVETFDREHFEPFMDAVAELDSINLTTEPQLLMAIRQIKALVARWPG